MITQIVGVATLTRNLITRRQIREARPKVQNC
jgi:hypothetical protein